LPGMTANVRVVTDSRESVLKVPNAALRMRIAGVEPAQAPASAPAQPGSAVTTGELRGGFFVSQALAQGGPGGGGAALRERLVSELQLNAEQQAKLDAVSAEMRPRFVAIRELPEAQRRAARDQVMTEMRQKITAFLTPPQKTQYQRMQEQGEAARGAGAAPPAAAPAGVATPQPGSVAPKSVASRAMPESARPTNEAAPTAGFAAATTTRAAAASVAPAPSAAPATAGTAGAPGGGGALTEFRNRLIAELQLTAAQTEKVDAIYADARPRFGQLRDLSAEERPKARERITADVRARIGDLLTPEQKAKYAVLVAESAGRSSTRGRIYLLDAQGKPKAYNVRLGISDGTSTELLVSPNDPQAQELKEGASVIIGTVGGTAPGSKPAAGGPRMPF